MRVVSFVPYASYMLHFETDLEIIQKHLDAGDDVEVIVCDADFASCDANPKHFFERCLACTSRRKAGFKALTGDFRTRNVWSIGKIDEAKLATLKLDFDSTDELKNYMFFGFDIGYAVLSSLVSMFREPAPDLRSTRNRNLLHKLLLTSAKLHLAFDSLLKEQQIDRVYVYNGRFATTRAVLRACESQGVDCFCHERGAMLDQYELYKNATPVDLDYFHECVQVAWQSSDPQMRDATARLFFDERRAAVVQSFIAFAEIQKSGLLPNNWNPSKRNVGIFISSEDEFVAAGREWEGKIYRNQEDGVQRIVDEFADDPDFFFYVRIHPHLKTANNSQTKALQTIEGTNLYVIPASSPISSYALIDACEKVVVFGSTVGVEAAYANKPVILCRPAFYSAMDIAYEPSSQQEVASLIRSKLKPKPLISVMKYGYYLRTFGERFKYFQPQGIWAGSFKGSHLQSSRFVDLAVKAIGGTREALAKAAEPLRSRRATELP